jgi:aspartate aminotransferase
MTAEFAKRRERVLEIVREIPGVVCPTPEGAFYIFPDMRSFYGKTDGNTVIHNAADLSMYLLNEAHVSSVMGDAFGEPTCVRFSFANSLPKIEEGWARIKKALAQLH